MSTLDVTVLPVKDNCSRKNICLAMYYGEIPLGRDSLYTLLTAIHIAENNTSAGLYAIKMRERLLDSHAWDEGSLKAILAVLITLL